MGIWKGIKGAFSELPLVGGLFKSQPGNISESGAFQGYKELGGKYSQFLMERLGQDVTKSRSFQLGSTALQEGIGQIAANQRESLGRNASAGGYRDSGEFMRLLQGVDTEEIQAFGGSLRDLIMALEDRRGQDVLPFLGAASNEIFNVRSSNQATKLGLRNSQNEGQATNAKFISDMMSMGKF